MIIGEKSVAILIWNESTYPGLIRGAISLILLSLDSKWSVSTIPNEIHSLVESVDFSTCFSWLSVNSSLLPNTAPHLNATGELIFLGKVQRSIIAGGKKKHVKIWYTCLLAVLMLTKWNWSFRIYPANRMNESHLELSDHLNLLMLLLQHPVVPLSVRERLPRTLTPLVSC